MVRATQYLFVLTFFVCAVLAASVFVWTLWRWRKIKSKAEPADWRTRTGLAAFVLGGLSFLLWIISIVWALAIVGFPYYSPSLLRFYRWGFYLSVASILACVPGKGNFRWPAFFASVMMIVLWVLTISRE